MFVQVTALLGGLGDFLCGGGPWGWEGGLLVVGLGGGGLSLGWLGSSVLWWEPGAGWVRRGGGMVSATLAGGMSRA